MAKTGRPSSYTTEKALRIAAEIADGRSLRTICAPSDMPSVVTVYSWLEKHEEFLKLYMRAKEDQADTFAEDILSISDNAQPDSIQVARLQVDSRKWLASKFKPKRYGTNNIDLTSGGEKVKSGGETTVFLHALTQEELDAHIAEAESKITDDA